MNEILDKLEEIRVLTLIGVKNVLNLTEAAIYIGISEDRLRHLASPKVGAISCSNVGKTLSFRKEDLDNYRMKNRRMSQDEISAVAETISMRGKALGSKFSTK